ncbi:MAG: TerC family protein, partial [Elusimicrobiota bacterium]
METRTLMWIVFNVAVLGLLFLDLKVFNRKAHEVKLKEASLWLLMWVSLALAFGIGVYVKLGDQKALEFLTGYLIEYSLSVDNMFVFIMIFAYFAVPVRCQPRVLHWGILGALVMRFILIFSGVALIERFHWIVYVFGELLIYTGIKMVGAHEEKMDPGKNPVLRLFKKVMPFDNSYVGDAFFVKKSGVWHATTLFACVLVVEASDLVFAVDSIPAVLAISRDPFIVYTSNIFAILGLRSLYFVLSSVMGL